MASTDLPVEASFKKQVFIIAIIRYCPCYGNSAYKKARERLFFPLLFLEVPPRFELGNKGFADLCLTSWLWRRVESRTGIGSAFICLERKTRLELATSTLARWRSTR